ncbi:hypothetical protein ACG7TL_004160 [Trametes sanguinea]
MSLIYIPFINFLNSLGLMGLFMVAVLVLAVPAFVCGVFPVVGASSAMPVTSVAFKICAAYCVLIWAFSALGPCTKRLLAHWLSLLDAYATYSLVSIFVFGLWYQSPTLDAVAAARRIRSSSEPESIWGWLSDVLLVTAFWLWITVRRLGALSSQLPVAAYRLLAPVLLALASRLLAPGLRLLAPVLAQLRAHLDKLNPLSAQVAQQASTIAKLEARLADLEEQLQYSIAEANAGDTTIAELSDTLEATHAIIGEKSTMLEAEHVANEELERALNGNGEALAGVMESLRLLQVDSEEESSRIKQEKEECERKVETLTRQLQEAQEQLTTNRIEATQQLEDIVSSLEEAREYDDLELQHAQEQLDIAQLMSTTLELQLKDKEDKAEEAAAHWQILQSEHMHNADLLASNLQHAQRQLESSEKTNLSLVGQIVEMETKQQELQAEVWRLETVDVNHRLEALRLQHAHQAEVQTIFDIQVKLVGDAKALEAYNVSLREQLEQKERIIAARDDAIVAISASNSVAVDCNVVTYKDACSATTTSPTVNLVDVGVQTADLPSTESTLSVQLLHMDAEHLELVMQDERERVNFDDFVVPSMSAALSWTGVLNSTPHESQDDLSLPFEDEGCVTLRPTANLQEEQEEQENQENQEEDQVATPQAPCTLPCAESFEVPDKLRDVSFDILHDDISFLCTGQDDSFWMKDEEEELDYRELFTVNYKRVTGRDAPPPKLRSEPASTPAEEAASDVLDEQASEPLETLDAHLPAPSSEISISSEPDGTSTLLPTETVAAPQAPCTLPCAESFEVPDKLRDVSFDILHDDVSFLCTGQDDSFWMKDEEEELDYRELFTVNYKRVTGRDPPPPKLRGELANTPDQEAASDVLNEQTSESLESLTAHLPTASSELSATEPDCGSTPRPTTETVDKPARVGYILTCAESFEIADKLRDVSCDLLRSELSFLGRDEDSFWLKNKKDADEEQPAVADTTPAEPHNAPAIPAEPVLPTEKSFEIADKLRSVSCDLLHSECSFSGLGKGDDSFWMKDDLEDADGDLLGAADTALASLPDASDNVLASESATDLLNDHIADITVKPAADPTEPSEPTDTPVDLSSHTDLTDSSSTFLAHLPPVESSSSLDICNKLQSVSCDPIHGMIPSESQCNDSLWLQEEVLNADAGPSEAKGTISPDDSFGEKDMSFASIVDGAYFRCDLSLGEEDISLDRIEGGASSYSSDSLGEKDMSIELPEHEAFFYSSDSFWAQQMGADPTPAFLPPLQHAAASEKQEEGLAYQVRAPLNDLRILATSAADTADPDAESSFDSHSTPLAEVASRSCEFEVGCTTDDISEGAPQVKLPTSAPPTPVKHPRISALRAARPRATPESRNFVDLESPEVLSWEGTNGTPTPTSPPAQSKKARKWKRGKGTSPRRPFSSLPIN